MDEGRSVTLESHAVSDHKRQYGRIDIPLLPPMFIQKPLYPEKESDGEARRARGRRRLEILLSAREHVQNIVNMQSPCSTTEIEKHFWSWWKEVEFQALVHKFLLPPFCKTCPLISSPWKARGCECRSPKHKKSRNLVELAWVGWWKYRRSTLLTFKLVGFGGFGSLSTMWEKKEDHGPTRRPHHITSHGFPQLHFLRITCMISMRLQL